MNHLTRDKQSLEKRLQHSNTKLSQTLSELSEEKQLSGALQANLTSCQKKHKELQIQFNEYKTAKESEITDLREQIRDVMFFFEAQKQIENSADKEDIAGGRIIIGQNTSSNSSASSSTNPTRTSRRQHKKH